MNRAQAKEAAQVMQAWAEGKEIQLRAAGSCHSWGTVSSESLRFNWGDYEYRIRPEPKYSRVLNVYRDGSTNVHKNEQSAKSMQGSTIIRQAYLIEVSKEEYDAFIKDNPPE